MFDIVQKILEAWGIPLQYQLLVLIGIPTIGAAWVLVWKWLDHRAERDYENISPQIHYAKDDDPYNLQWEPGELIPISQFDGLLPNRTEQAGRATKPGNPAITMAYASDQARFLRAVIYAIKTASTFMMNAREIIRKYRLYSEEFLVMVVCEKYPEHGIPEMMKAFVIAKAYLHRFLKDDFCEKVKNRMSDVRLHDRVDTLHHMAQIYFKDHGKMRQTWRTWLQWVFFPWTQRQMVQVVAEIAIPTERALTAKEIVEAVAAEVARLASGTKPESLKGRLASLPSDASL